MSKLKDTPADGREELRVDFRAKVDTVAGGTRWIVPASAHRETRGGRSTIWVQEPDGLRAFRVPLAIRKAAKK